MPGRFVMRYHFDTFDGQEWVTDEVGTDYDTREAARALAHAALADMAKDEVPNGSDRQLIVRMRDGVGLPLLETSLDFRTKWLR